jgi:5-methyltetrahydrofolate--homocysteine methyltransferase
MGNIITKVNSDTKEVFISRDLPTVIIGERLNPTGREKLQQELREHKFNIVRRDAIAQIEAGASILDINAGMPQIDESTLLVEMVEVVTEVTDVPLCIDTTNIKALEAALKAYKGKALINSVTGEECILEPVLALVKEYNAAIIVLLMDNKGIPMNVDKRLLMAEKIIQKATGTGISLEDIIIDPLVLSIGAYDQAARIALETIEAAVRRFGTNITMGCGNVSFGLPNRSVVSLAFITMAMRCGLTCPITNPLDVQIKEAILAGDLCMGRDKYATNWLRNYREKTKK